MNRRDFLRRASLLVAAGIAADQIELLEKLTWKRTLFSGIDYSQHILVFDSYTKGEDGITYIRYKHALAGDRLISLHTDPLVLPTQRLPLRFK